MAADGDDEDSTRVYDAEDDSEFVATRVAWDDEEDDVATDGDDLAATRVAVDEARVATRVATDGDDLARSGAPPGVPDFAATFRMESPEVAALADRPTDAVIEAAIEESLSQHPPAPTPQRPMGLEPRPAPMPQSARATVPPLAAQRGRGNVLGVVVAVVLVIAVVLVATALLII